MAVAAFDLRGAVRFDLSEGLVRSGSIEEPLLLLPAAALDEIVESVPPAVVETLGRRLGAAIGTRASRRVENASSASIDAFLTALAAETALAGLGSLSLERWGRAIVIVIEHAHLSKRLLAPLFASALETAAGRKVWCAMLEANGKAVRILVTGERGADRVAGWIASGMPWGEALMKLHEA